MSKKNELLTDVGMASVRAGLISAFPWFLHQSSFQALSAIRQRGLEPRDPEPNYPLPHEVMETIGESARRIVCLRPIGTTPIQIAHDEGSCLLAVSATDLPSKIGIDWSFPLQWQLIDVLEKEDVSGTMNLCELAVQIARRGSIASYEQIGPDALWVCTHGSDHNDPSTWEKLNRVSDSNVVRL